MTHRFARLAAVAALATLLPAAATAQTTFFTTQAGWTAALNGGGSGLDNYNDLTFGASQPGPLNRAAGAFTYRATSGGDGVFFAAGTSADRWLSPNQAASAITLDNFSGSANAVGGFIFGSDITGAFLNGPLTVSWVTSLGAGSTTVTAPSSTSFWGLVTTGTVTSLTIAGQGANTPFIWGTVNDFRVGRALPSTVIPEPSTYALMATGLVALGLLRRRRA